MKKVLNLSLALSLMLMLAACGGGGDTTTAGTSTAGGTTEAATEDTAEGQEGEDTAIDVEEVDFGDMKIGVVQLAEHAALDSSTAGFVDTLVAAGMPLENIEVMNAQGEQSNCNTMALTFVNNQVDLILAVATPAAQAVANSTSEIPVLATAVTDFDVAGLTASNITGVSDMGPVARQVELLLELAPEAENIGVLYCSSEDNSILQAGIALETISGQGMNAIEFTVADTNEVQQVVQSMVGKVDAIYIPTDNTLAQTMPVVNMIATPAGIPVVCGEGDMVAAGGLCTIGVDYYGLGVATAKQAIRILIDGEDISTIPVEFSDESSWTLMVNEEVQAALGIESMPEGLMG